MCSSFVAGCTGDGVSASAGQAWSAAGHSPALAVLAPTSCPLLAALLGLTGTV